jgi:BMFP domain-containing protein YqiC
MNAIPNFDTFFKQFTETLPKGLLGLHHDLEKNLRVGMEATFRKMNLVTREEFEIQCAVLERTRTRLEALEVKIAAFEVAQKPVLPDQPNQAE